MGVRLPSVATITNVGVLNSTGTESLIMTAPPINVSLAFASLLIYWYFMGNSGNGTTALMCRLRRGPTLSGATVGIGQFVTVTANATVLMSGCYLDTPGDIAGLQYSWTLQGTATSGVGNFLEGCLAVFML